MERIREVIKPYIPNAIIPRFLSTLLYASVLVFVTLLMFSLVQPFLAFEFTARQIIAFGITVTLLITIISLLEEFIKLVNTEYRFNEEDIEIYYKFFTQHSRSIAYDHIIEVKSYQSMWDRITNSGNIMLATGIDDQVDFSLNHIKDVEEKREMLQNFIKEAKAEHSEENKQK